MQSPPAGRASLLPQSVRCPEANLSSPEFWTPLSATSNMINVLIRSAGTHQAIWPGHFCHIKNKDTQWKREKSLQLSLLQLEEFGLPQPWMPSRTDESLPDSTCCSLEREAQSLGDLGFWESPPQTKCDHMDETDCVAAIGIGKGHLFFSRSTQTSLQKCHAVAQGSSKKQKKKKKKQNQKKKKKRKSNNNTKGKPNHLSVFPIQRSAQHAAGQQSSRMLYKSAISMSSKGSAGWTKVHSSHCSHVMLASGEQNVISKTFFPVIFWSQRAHISTSVPCCKPQELSEVVVGGKGGCAEPWKEASQGGCCIRCCKQEAQASPLPLLRQAVPLWQLRCSPSQSAVTHRSRCILYTAEAIYRSTCLHRAPHALQLPERLPSGSRIRPQI